MSNQPSRVIRSPLIDNYVDACVAFNRALVDVLQKDNPTYQHGHLETHVMRYIVRVNLCEYEMHYTMHYNPVEDLVVFKITLIAEGEQIVHVIEATEVLYRHWRHLQQALNFLYDRTNAYSHLAQCC